MSISNEYDLPGKAVVLVTGNFEYRDIQIRSTGEKFIPQPELSQKIDELWRPKAEKGWFPGPLARLEDYHLDADGRLHLSVGDTDFAQYVGTRDKISLARYGVNALANPLSVSLAVITSDSKLMVTKKTKGDALGAYDLIGGYMHPDEHPFQTSLREYSEEVVFGREKLTPGEIKKTQNEILSLICLGLCYEIGEAEDLCHPVLSFLLRAKYSSNDYVPPETTDEVRIIITDPLNDSNGSIPNTFELFGSLNSHTEPDGLITTHLAADYLLGQNSQKQIYRSMGDIRV